MRLLQRDSVGANDNFFEIGGHSLMSVRLVYALRQELGRALAISDIFEHPTIEDMAKYLGEDEQSPRKWTSLIPLQSKGSKSPLFCIHGWGGAVFGFIELAKHFAPDRPVYGLQAVGLEGEAPRHSTIEEMAAHYAKRDSDGAATRTLQSRGVLYGRLDCLCRCPGTYRSGRSGRIPRTA